MAANRIRQALGAAAVLALLVSTAALADTLMADGDSLTAGAQTSVNLGTVAAGDSRAVDVDFVLTCNNSSHLAAGTTVSVVEAGLTVPNDGSAVVSPGLIEVPSTWPASGVSCTAADTVTSTTPAHIVVTAPSTTGPGQEFDVMFAPDPDTGGVSNVIAFSLFMDVVDPAPSGTPPPDDTTPPVLHGVPDSMTVTVTGTSAVVSWPSPTATDDTDPDPSVACDPPSGSTFGLGTTTVTCTATDASGNSASATFEVTVEDPPALTGVWGRPLGDTMPALVGRLKRTVPLKLTITAGDVVQGPSDIATPSLSAALLDSCDAGATAGQEQAVGDLTWNNGRWRLNLRTAALGAGCWQLTATVGGVPVATAVIRLVDGPVGADKHDTQAAVKAARQEAKAAAKAAREEARAAAKAAKRATRNSAGHKHQS